MQTLQTNRLILRSWTIDDLDDLFAYAKNPNVGPHAGWAPHTNKDVTEKILKSFIQKDDVWAIEYNENHKVIGSLGLHKDNTREGVQAKMIGYVLSEDYWGQGLVTEAVQRVIQFAFEELNLDVLSVFHFPANIQSKRVIEKCGFTYEGTLRCACKIYDGTIMDQVCYSITKQEYLP